MCLVLVRTGASNVMRQAGMIPTISSYALGSMK